ncbi:hypothetical protein Ahy_A10g046883 [Arachis hypogaea]|uniref:TF-B3 domain-containing protein n=1 Tax=Arachis hypogaea TaxID=3818 RepID=A0A445B0T7_ARAHY|nr:hypothetical protein Ahy_A10g046883 [Arachis hypogaea]
MASSRFQKNKRSRSSVIRFFKIVLRHSLEDGKLKVPKMFNMKHGRGVPNPVYLKPPDGTAWKIDWSEYDGAILFENGWKEFASYYSLHNGHLLWFEYNQTSNIVVYIFDMTCLEIDYPSLDHVSDDDSIEILNELPPRGWPRKTEKAAPKTPSASTSKMVTSSAKTKVVKGCPERNYPSKDHIDDVNMVKVENEPPRRGRGRPRKTEKAARNKPSPCTSKKVTSSAKNRVVKRCPEIGYPSKNHINNDNMVKVVNEPPRRGRGRPRKTEKAAPKTPSACTSKRFTSSANTRMVKWCPEIDYPSKDHIDDHNMVKVENEPPRRGRGRPRKKLKAAVEVSSPSTSKTLWSSVKTGDVEKGPDMLCCKNEEASQSEETGLKMPTIPSASVDPYMACNIVILSSGWVSFARENNLKAGDICIFELVYREGAELDAHIFLRNA